MEARLTEAAAIETGLLAGLSIDTTGLAVSAAADLVCARLGLWPPWVSTRLGGQGPRSDPRPKGAAAEGVLLLVCGLAPLVVREPDRIRTGTAVARRRFTLLAAEKQPDDLSPTENPYPG